jgi:hypothetical protein
MMNERELKGASCSEGSKEELRKLNKNERELKERKKIVKRNEGE